MRALAATLTHRIDVPRRSHFAAGCGGRNSFAGTQSQFPTPTIGDRELDQQVARLEDGDDASQRMVAGLVLVVTFLYAAGLAWLLLPVEGIVAAVRQL